MTASWRTVPSRGFLIGAAKCGTSSLARRLDCSPDVCVSIPKEPLFFEADFERGLDYYWQTYFPHWRGERLVIDGRHRNMFLPYVPRRIASVDLGASIFAILREPVGRAFSHWWELAGGATEPMSFEDALEDNRQRIVSGPDFTEIHGPEMWRASLLRSRGGVKSSGSTYRTYLDSGHYAEQLARYIGLFGRDRVHVMFLEELVTDPAAELARLAHHLGIESDGTFTRSNEAKVRRSYRGGSLAGRVARSRVSKLVPASLRLGIRRFLMKEQARGTMTDITMADLEEYYAPHNAALETLLERRLPEAWVPTGARNPTLSRQGSADHLVIPPASSRKEPLDGD